MAAAAVAQRPSLSFRFNQPISGVYKTRGLWFFRSPRNEEIHCVSYKKISEGLIWTFTRLAEYPGMAKQQHNGTNTTERQSQ